MPYIAQLPLPLPDPTSLRLSLSQVKDTIAAIDLAHWRGEIGWDIYAPISTISHALKAELEASERATGRRLWPAIVRTKPKKVRRDVERIEYKKDHYGRLPAFIRKKLTISEGAAVHVMLLAMRGHSRRVCDRSLEELANRARCCVRTVAEARRKLAALGIFRIRVRKNPGAKHDPSVVSINPDHPLGQELMNWLEQGWSWFRAKAEAAKAVVSALAIKAVDAVAEAASTGPLPAIGIGGKSLPASEDILLREKNESRSTAVSEAKASSKRLDEALNRFTDTGRQRFSGRKPDD